MEAVFAQLLHISLNAFDSNEIEKSVLAVQSKNMWTSKSSFMTKVVTIEMFVGHYKVDHYVKSPTSQITAHKVQIKEMDSIHQSPATADFDPVLDWNHQFIDILVWIVAIQIGSSSK